jgi:polyisoprenoid-binding protein YceI
MTRTTKHCFSIGLTLLVCAMSSPTSAALSNGESKVVFKATGPGGLSFEGKSSSANLKESGNSVVVSVKLDTLVTGIDLRDRHMKEKYLETGKYPTAILEVEKPKLQLPSGKAVSATVDGKLTLHGVTRPVKVNYHADGDSKQAKVEGTMRINMNEFKIEVPSYLGVTVKPNVDITVNLAVFDK